MSREYLSMKRVNPFIAKAGLLAVLLLGVSLQAAASAQERLGAVPQMGFNNWNSTHCRDEFNEQMIRGIADKIVSLGLRDAG